MSSRRAPGFTLIEVLVSVVLMAVLAALCYEALNYVRGAREATAAAFERVRAVEMSMHVLTTDFEQLEPRPVRDLLGASSIPALLADGRSNDLVVLTRGGWPNPAGLPRGTLQRVTYTLDNGTLIRQYPTVLDATLANTPVRRELLKDVIAIRIRYMDQSRQWQDQWPPLAANAANNALPLSTRPIAVEITLETKDLGKVTRLVEIAG
jgi:general secretion pathway protein J